MDHLAEVKRIILDGLKSHQARVFLFGSQARGDAARWSDIDVAVLPLEPLPVGLLSAIRGQLEESTIPYTVDLVDLTQAGPSLREFVEREGLLWTT